MKKRELGLTLILVFLFSTFAHMQSVYAITWSDENRLTTYLQVDSAPSITQTSDHRIWIVWEKQAASNLAIFYTTSSDHGISWSPEKNITKVPSSDTNIDPSITQLSNGTMIVVWSSNRLPPPEPDFVLSAAPSSLSIPLGSSNTSTIIATSVGGFSGPVDLSVRTVMPPSPHISTSLTPTQVTPPPNGEANSTLSITVGAAAAPGDYTIIVNGHSESLNKTKSVNVALTVTAAAGSATSSSTRTGSPSGLPSETQQDYEIYLKASHDNGTSWTTAVRLTQNQTDDKGPVVMQAANGTIWLVWSSFRTGNYEIWFKTSSDMGASWSPPAQLTIDAAADAFPAVAQMSDGRIWVAWHSGRYLNNGGMEILYDIYDGSSWVGVERLTDTSKDVDDTCPAILQTANGTIWLFWASEGDTQPPFILYTQSSDNGNIWSDAIEFTTGLVDKWPTTTQTIDRKVWVVWASTRDGNWELYHKTSFIHNVAVTDIIPSETRVYQKEIVSLDVTIQNYGDYNETFTVTCYVNSTLIGSQNIGLIARTSDTLTFLWDTSVFSRGNYRIKANASIVDGEAYIEDNTRMHGTVRVKLLGDVDDSGVVDTDDISPFSEAFGSLPGNSNWDEEADMNGDDEVNIIDLFALGENFGKTE